MLKKIFSMFMICALFIGVTACGPSDEKVAQAQQKYAELVEIHNQAVEAHKNITDNSLDESLTKLQDQITDVEEYNLTEMKDEEIDLLIQIMDTLISSYEECLDTLTDIKEEEEEAVVVPIPVTLVNQTTFSFSEMKLYEAGDVGLHENVLLGLKDFAPGETLTGLTLQRDVSNTPWVLEFIDANGNDYQFDLMVEEYDEEGIKLTLSYDAEENVISLN